MPNLPAKPCLFPGCANKVLGGGSYCEKHQENNTSKFRNKKSRSHKWYYTTLWKRLRHRQLSIRPLCEECEKNGEITQANVVDHMKDFLLGKDIQEQWKLFTDHCNHRSLCRSCHNRKTGRTNKA